MFERKIDERPGPLPDIRRDGESIVYSLRIASVRAQLVLRCDSDGTICARLAVTPEPN